MTRAPTVRPSVVADRPALLELLHAAYRGYGGWTTEADLIDGPRTDAAMLAEDLADPARTMLVATTDVVLACCAVTVLDAATASFGMFAVAPARQGGGLGTRMLAAAEALACDRGVTTMEMCVLSGRRELLAWYGRRGYEASGETRPFPYDEPRCGWPRRDDLVFRVLTKALVPGSVPGSDPCRR